LDMLGARQEIRVSTVPASPTGDLIKILSDGFGKGICN
jgi:hypothetical protein